MSTELLYMVPPLSLPPLSGKHTTRRAITVLHITDFDIYVYIYIISYTMKRFVTKVDVVKKTFYHTYLIAPNLDDTINRSGGHRIRSHPSPEEGKVHQLQRVTHTSLSMVGLHQSLHISFQFNLFKHFLSESSVSTQRSIEERTAPCNTRALIHVYSHPLVQMPPHRRGDFPSR